MKKFLHSMFGEILRTNNLKELSFISISSIRSRGAFDAAIDWRDAHPEGPEAEVLRLPGRSGADLQ
jgi:hypothetical protein